MVGDNINLRFNVVNLNGSSSLYVKGKTETFYLFISSVVGCKATGRIEVGNNNNGNALVQFFG